MKRSTLTMRLGLLLVLPFFLLFTACDTVDDEHDPHGDMERLVVESLAEGEAGQQLAEWTHDDGWDQESFPPIHIHDYHDGDEGHATVNSEHGHDNGEHAAWRIRVWDDGGNEIALSEGGEYAVRYQTTDADQHVIYFSPDGHVHIDDEEAELFHGDHVHVYPREEGATDIQFLLWHGNHSDAETDPITVVVEAEDDHGDHDHHDH